MTRYTFLPIEFGAICIVGGEAGLSGVRLCAEPADVARRLMERDRGTSSPPTAGTGAGRYSARRRAPAAPRDAAGAPGDAVAAAPGHAGAMTHDPDLLPGLQADLRAYFAGEPVTFDVELDLNGLAPFHQRALRACARVPYGQTTTYKELAAKVGSPNAARAVGTAMARNPIAIVIPCHRVLAANKALGGYSAPQGLALKRHLLDMEARGLHRLEAGATWRATG